MARRPDDDDAPWLAEATPARGGTTVSKRSLFWTLFIVLGLATIAAVGLILLMSKKDGGSTQGYMAADQAPVITAEPGPYKIAPSDPAGMTIDGLDGTMYTAGEGIDAGSNIDPSLAPEAPLPRPGTKTGVPRDLIPEEGMETFPPAPAAVAIAPAAVSRSAPVVPPAISAAVPKAAPAKPAVAVPKPVIATARPVIAPPTATAKPGIIQLGAFSTEEKASAVWAGLAGKHGLSGKRITAIESGGKTLYRQRASSADPAATCARMKAAGDACAAVE